MAATIPAEDSSSPSSQNPPGQPHGQASEDVATADMMEPARTTSSAATSQDEATRSEKGSDDPNTLDAFEDTFGDDPPEPPRASVDLDDLPIELIGLTDSFIDSLSAKVHPSPPNIDSLARRFQEFYEQAASHIHTHINSLATRQMRERTSAYATSSSKPSAASLLRAKATSLGGKERHKAQPARRDAEQQMLTAEELAILKRNRKALEQKRSLLEEAVERRLCEGIYSRIYRHHTTQDEAQDDKLRSKTAALSVVGIGPADLGVDLGEPTPTPDVAARQQEEVREWLGPARRELVLMNQSRYPLGKLNRLKAAHKSIIDTLSHFHPSSSADELMPMLIYTLISLPPEDLNVVSDLHFIRRFRWERKLTGEAAYCLTTLEATITFLDTVDLSTLRSDEAPSGPSKPGGGPETPRIETFPPAYSSGPPTQPPGASQTDTPALRSTSSSSALRPPAPSRNRRLSGLVTTPAQAIGAASDAVLHTADHGFKTIGSSLGESYKFLLSKIREDPAGSASSGGDVILPKTLEDARKLIGTPPPEEDMSISNITSDLILEDAELPSQRPSREDRMLNLIGGRKGSREASADRARSVSNNSKKAPPTDGTREKEKPGAATASPSSSSPTPPPNPALIDSVRHLSNTFNPMARLTGIGGFRGFSRTASMPVAPTAKDAPGKAPADGGDLATAFPDIAAALPPKEAPKIPPPIKRFMELQNPADLRIREVLELLRDYKRLASALKEMDAFKE